MIGAEQEVRRYAGILDGSFLGGRSADLDRASGPGLQAARRGDRAIRAARVGRRSPA